MEPAGGISANELGVSRPPFSWQSAPGEGGENNVIAAAAQSEAAQTVSIYCIYSANPSELLPNSTRWFKDGRQLLNISANGDDDDTSRRAHLSESLTATGYPVLNINQVSRRDAGRYECQLANAVGTSERLPVSEAARLEVNFRPSVRLRLFKLASQTTRYPISAASTGSKQRFQMEELTEMVDPSEQLILAGQTYVLVCDVLEARPDKIEKFHWFRKSLAGPQQPQRPHQLIGISEASQFVLSSLAANFSRASYACAAANALGPGDTSNQLELQLSYSPGKYTNKPCLSSLASLVAARP